MVVTIIMPALNEEANILFAIDNTLKVFKDCNIDGEIIVINDGSKDKTGEIIKKQISQHPDKIRIINHNVPQGIGACFWDGVKNAKGDIVCMLPGDNENDPWEIFRYYKLLEHVDIVIPFIFNKEARSLFRNALSFVYRFIINSTFAVYLNYTNGTVLYRKSLLKELDYRSNSFFFQTDILIRAVKKGYLFAEVPYKINKRKDGVSKAISFPSLFQVMKGYLHLVRDFYLKNAKNSNLRFSKGSATATRRQNKQ